VKLMFDATVISAVAYKPEKEPALYAWFRTVVTSPAHRPMRAAVTDYEVRRGLVYKGSARGLERLDWIVARLDYVPLDDAIAQRAAAFWAEVRHKGRPTGAGLDADALLAAAASVAGATLITHNLKHLSRYPIEARVWRDVV